MSTTSSGQPRARSSSFSNTGGASGSATAGDTKDLEKYVKHLFYKASQIVVQSRQVRMVRIVLWKSKADFPWMSPVLKLHRICVYLMTSDPYLWFKLANAPLPQLSDSSVSYLTGWQAFHVFSAQPHLTVMVLPGHQRQL